MSYDPNAAARQAAQLEGQRTLARIAQEEAARIAEHAGDKITSLEDLDSITWARQQTAIANDLVEKQRRLTELHNEPVASEIRNKFEFLTNDELLTLSRLEQQRASQKAEFEKQFVSFGQWVLNNRSFPSSPEAANVIVQHLRASNRSMAHANLDSAWSELQASGNLRPDYSQRNHAAHDANVEELRASGIRVDPAPDPLTASREELNAFLGHHQPPPTLDNLTARVETPDLFDGPIERFEVPDQWA